MNATKELTNEHKAIELMLRILDAISQKITSGGQVPPKDLDGIAEFLSVFVDSCHHGKEEDHLFPALEKGGVPRAGGPIGILLEEHEQGRQIAACLKATFGEYAGGNKDAAGEISKAVGEYVTLLTQHIEKENNVLFPMADGRVNEAEDVRIVDSFEELERDRIGPGKHDEFHEMLGRLKRLYLG
jgi:hemerythrin-like domain-containing protein